MKHNLLKGGLKLVISFIPLAGILGHSFKRFSGFLFVCLLGGYFAAFLKLL